MIPPAVGYKDFLRAQEVLSGPESPERPKKAVRLLKSALSGMTAALADNLLEYNLAYLYMAIVGTFLVGG